MKEKKEQKTGKIVLYKDNLGPELKVTLEDDTVWLSQAQMADLFGKDLRTVNDHIKNVYKEAELSQNRTIRKFRIVQTEGKRQIARDVNFYNLDVIISVGYRVKSKRGTQFRIWATQRLRDYVLKGFAINEQRLKEKSQAKLKELEGAVKLFQKAISSSKVLGLEKQLLSVITEYASTWTTLVKFDEGDLVQEKESKGSVDISYEELSVVISRFTERLKKNKLADKDFGVEKPGEFQKIVSAINKLQEGVVHQGARLFYMVIKTEPFISGNKQIASLLLLVHLINNNIFYNRRGERKLDDSTVVALSLLVEETSSKDEEAMLGLIGSMISKK